MSERICGALGCANDAEVIVRHESGRRAFSCRECVDGMTDEYGDAVEIAEEL